MSGNMPELGSKISLISKADIRYEGRLFTVDPNECTIALASVRSFGTEDRETQFPIAAQNQVYDYILFRGSDIKDIRVCNPTPPVPNDPAIMQMHLPPQQAPGMPPVGGGQPPFQPPHFAPMGGGGGMMPGQQPGPFGPFGMGQVGGGGGMPGAPNAGLMAAMLEFIGGGSRSTTPHSLISRKSPSNDMGVQAGSGGNQNQNNQSRESNRGGDKRNNSQSSGGNNNNNQNQQQQHQRNRRDSGRAQDDNNKQQGQNNNNQVQQQQQGHRNQHNSNGQFNNKYQRIPQQQGPQGGQNGNNQQQQQQRMGGGGGWVQRNNNMGPGGGGPGGPGGMPNQMRGQRGGRMNMRPMNNPNFRQMNPNMKPRVPGKPIKFENDYDFEQANSKFEELFQKLKVGDGSANNPDDKNGEQVNGDAPEKKDDSGNETGAGEQEPEDDAHDSHGYDKTKSFFDNISCEAQTDRKGKPRVDWRQERKLNSETFGVASTRRGGMGYRGRGGHNNYNQAGGYFRQNQNNHHQGGYRNNNNQHPGNNGQGGYRNNYRRHNNMRMNGTNPQSTGIPTASVTKQQPQQATAGPSNAAAAAAGPQTAAQVVAAN